LTPPSGVTGVIWRTNCWTPFRFTADDDVEGLREIFVGERDGVLIGLQGPVSDDAIARYAQRMPAKLEDPRVLKSRSMPSAGSTRPPARWTSGFCYSSTMAMKPLSCCRQPTRPAR
jgi:hypothetical protein